MRLSWSRGRMTAKELWTWTALFSTPRDVPRMTQTVPPWRRIKVAVHSSWFVIVFSAFAFTYLTRSIVALSPDGEALLAFKAVLQDPIGILNSWEASDPDPCLWDGVTCNTNLKVQRLRLQDTQLSGTILGPALQNLTELRTLVLARNNFSGAFPLELSQIETLWKLNMSENGLSGALPASLGNLSRLRMLDLSRNAFTGQIPPDLFKACETLRYISLAENRFSGAIPSTIWQCTTLVAVNIAFNSLQGTVPPALANLTLLEFIDLHKNQLSGNIPAHLSRLTNLAYLDLGGNLIGGAIPPGLGALVRLQSLNLARMCLRGTIPASLANLTLLQQLDLSSNNLTGNILSELGLLSGMRGLFLQYNSLDGTIPASLGDLVNLTRFNVSYNELSGRIPDTNGFVRFDNTSYMSNKDLCGPPLSTPCAVVVSTPAPTPVVHSSRRMLSVSALIAIAATGAFGLGVVFITLLSICAMRKKVAKPETEIFFYESTPPTPDQDVASPIVGKLVLFNTVFPTRFGDWEMSTEALLSKECLVGHGTLGTVYCATYNDSLSIAIKKLNTLGRIRNAEEFGSEMDYLGDVRHSNLVTLQGYYWSSSMQLMLSDWIANGTLASHLHGSDSQGSTTTLVWSRRFRIAIGVARGLAYLHHELRSPVLHLNISSMNVLIDESFEPKISDFGMMKLLPTLDAHATKRTRVYAAPELAGASPCVTPKCDVYSYGMVLLELVTGRHPNSAHHVGVSGVNGLAEFVIRTLESGNCPDCFDPKLTFFPEGEVVQVLKLALVCTAQVASNRPTMWEAVQVMESVKPSGSWTSRSPSP